MKGPRHAVFLWRGRKRCIHSKVACYGYGAPTTDARPEAVSILGIVTRHSSTTVVNTTSQWNFIYKNAGKWEA